MFYQKEEAESYSKANTQVSTEERKEISAMPIGETKNLKTVEKPESATVCLIIKFARVCRSKVLQKAGHVFQKEKQHPAINFFTFCSTFQV